MENYTPHNIKLKVGLITIDIPPSGIVARVKTNTFEKGSVIVNGAEIPKVTKEFGDVENLPNEDERYEMGGVIVSSMVLNALPKGTPGVFAPDTENAERDSHGNILSIKNLVAP